MARHVDHRGSLNPRWKGADIVSDDGTEARIRLASGEIVRLDSEDLHLVKDWSWCRLLNHKDEKRGVTKYAYCRQGSTTTLMHRVIMRAQKGQIVDHVNRDGLDNRKGNLRFVTASQNNHNASWNERGRRGRINPYLGVWPRPSGRFYAAIKIDGKQRTIGTFDTAEEARDAYLAKKKEIFA